MLVYPMNASDHEIDFLVDLGLTGCQARVYLALCIYGILDAKTVSKYASIPRPDVYRVTESLENLGIIEKIISRPVSFKAIKAEKVIGILLEHKKETIRRLGSKKGIFLNKLKIKKKKTLPLKSQFVFVPPGEAILDRLRNSVEQAKRSIDAVTSWKRFKHTMEFSESFEKAWSEGVRFRWIVGRPERGKALESVLQFCEKGNLCEIRYIPSTPKTVIAICDQKESFLFVNPEASLSMSPALWTNNHSILAALKDYFDILWLTALEAPDYILDGEKVSGL